MSAPQPPWHRLRIESLAHATRYTTHAMTYGIQEVANECRIGARRYPFIATTNAAPPRSAPTMRADRCDSFMGSLADPISSTAFRCIESLVCRPDQIVWPHPRCHRSYSSAERDWDAGVVEHELMAFADPTKLVTSPCGVLAGGLRKHETQLFSAVACQALLAPRPDTKNGGQLAQHEVAREVAVPVVHVLEVVDVDQQDSQRTAVSRGTCDLTLEKLEQVPTVVEVRERIRDGQAIERVVVLRFHPARLLRREELEDDRAHPDKISGGQQLLAGHALVVHERAVRRMVIAGHDALSGRNDRAVQTRDIVRVKDHVAVERATKRREGRVQKDGPSKIRSVNLQKARPFQALRSGEAKRNARHRPHERSIGNRIAGVK